MKGDLAEREECRALCLGHTANSCVTVIRFHGWCAIRILSQDNVRRHTVCAGVFLFSYTNSKQYFNDEMEDSCYGYF